MSFDRLARHYDWLESLTAGSRLQRARTAWLPALRGHRRILSVGEGHGRFAAACVAQYPAAELTCVEASPLMLARAQRRLAGQPANILWRQSDFFAWQPEGVYDAIVTCFFLDCFTPGQLAQVIAKLAGCARPDAVWLLADFAVPEAGPPRWRAQFAHALMYNFFRFATGLPARRLTPPDDLLRAQGFVLTARQPLDWGLIHSDVWLRD